ncbi:hypothetical protein F511_45113 [Dorcoceras hygrometricum]|uniref:Uncharacterized protein n=1 Tax=Dorcoceras hygrometricum TaxID=472368 RepID=A0A2Z6ZWQ6_9LAMI|nr:hypothetical protein F511_45113 [Dorcoceras hygrometricum]
MQRGSSPRSLTVVHGWGRGWVRWNRLYLGVVQPAGLRPGWPEQRGRTAQVAGCGVKGAAGCMESRAW